MSDAAGQPSDGFHLLRLSILLFQALLFGNVAQDHRENFLPGNRALRNGCLERKSFTVGAAAVHSSQGIHARPRFTHVRKVTHVFAMYAATVLRNELLERLPENVDAFDAKDL